MQSPAAMPVRSTLLSLACAATLGACGETITLSDDIDLTWDFGPTLSRFEDDLHTPYVAGTKVRLLVSSSDDDRGFQGWTVASSDPAVFRIDRGAPTGTRLSVEGQAVGEGEAILSVLDAHGNRVGRGVAEVLAPDRIELEAHGYLILDREDEAAISDLRVLEAGEATYLVRYFRGDRELHGNGVLGVKVPEGVTGEVRQSFLFENREWLTIHAGSPGQRSIELLADNRPLGSRPIVTVAPSAIADVIILTENEAQRADGDMLVALAQAYDTTGERVFGIDYEWDVDGIEQLGEGDLYRYELKRGASQMVTARTAMGASDSVMIQSEHGFVDSSNDVGCAAGSAGSATTVLGLLGVLGLVGLRRRRQA